MFKKNIFIIIAIIIVIVLLISSYFILTNKDIKTILIEGGEWSTSYWMDHLETQVDNLAEKVATKDRNRKHNIRRDVRDYLNELRTDK